MDIARKHPNKKKKLVGRGGSRGKTSGRGTKGQKARAGHSIRPEIRDQIKKLPKLRGYRFSSIQADPIAINLAQINDKFESGETVSPLTLAEKKIITDKKAVTGKIKILGNGDLTKKVDIAGCLVSKAALEKVEAR